MTNAGARAARAWGRPHGNDRNRVRSSTGVRCSAWELDPGRVAEPLPDRARSVPCFIGRKRNKLPHVTDPALGGGAGPATLPGSRRSPCVPVGSLTYRPIASRS